MKKADISFFCCLGCGADLFLETFVGNEDCIEEGVLFCISCKTYYPISEAIPSFLDSGYYLYSDMQHFWQRWESNFDTFAALKPRPLGRGKKAPLSINPEQTPPFRTGCVERVDFKDYKPLKKEHNTINLKQLNFYNTDAENYDELVMDTNFWKATDANVFADWTSTINPNDTILDIGCGTGRCSMFMARKAERVFAADISIGMLRKAIVKTKTANLHNITYFLADAEALPLKRELFSAVISYGMLHHVSRPQLVIKSAKDLLKPAGRFYALENHASMARPLFEVLMRVWKLWNEEAGSKSLFKLAEVKELIENNGMKGDIRTSVFLPPHIFNFISYTFAKKILATTDWLCGHIPLVKNFGGQLIIKATKIEEER